MRAVISVAELAITVAAVALGPPGWAGALLAGGLGIGFALLNSTVLGVSPKVASLKTPALGGGAASSIASVSGRTISVRQPVAPWPIIFGSCRVGGIITFVGTSGPSNEYLNVVYTLAGHQVQAINQIYLDGKLVNLDANGNGTGIYGLDAIGQPVLHVEKNLGTPTQAAFPGLMVQMPFTWLGNYTQSGRAGVYLRLKFSTTVFPAGLPNITFDVLGYNQIWDPRTGATGYTNNAALCCAAYLADASFGLKSPHSEFSTADLIEAANTCDEIVPIINPTVYTCITDGFLTVSPANTGTVGPPEPLLGDQVQFFTLSGQGSLPAGITAGVNYYWIPGFHQVATSLANAMAVIGQPIGAATIQMRRVGEARYRCDGTFTTDQTPQTVLQTMLTAMGGSAGRASWIAGTWVLHAGAYRTPTVTFTEADLRRPFKVLTTVARRETFNAVKGVYLSPANGWQPSDYPVVTNATFKAADANETIWKDFNLSFTASAEAAERIATLELQRSRREITIAQYPLKLVGYQVQAGDTVMISDAVLGWSSKVFDVVSATLAADQATDGTPIPGVDLSLREIDSNAFLWAGTVGATGLNIAAAKTNLPNPNFCAAPGVPSATESFYVTRNVSLKSKVTVVWAAAPDAFVNQYQVDYGPPNLPPTSVLPPVLSPTLTLDIFDLAAGTYDVGVTAINILGVRSTRSVGHAIQIASLGGAPEDPSGVSITAINGLAFLQWDRPVGLDVRVGGYKRVRWSSAQTGATWQNATDIGPVINGDSTHAYLPLMGGSYLVRNYNSAGLPSINFVAVTTSGPSTQIFGNVFVQAEHPGFAGALANVVVLGGGLQLAGTTTLSTFSSFGSQISVAASGGVVGEGSYLFASVMDLGAPQNVRLTSIVSALVFNPLNNIDTRTGKVDSWADWDGTVSGDANAKLFVSTTTNDPTQSPVWSAYQVLTTGDYGARAFRFRLDLTTLDAAYNIQVTFLEVIAEW